MSAQTNYSELEPIEKASQDELQALQLQRLKATLQHAYTMYRITEKVLMIREFNLMI